MGGGCGAAGGGGEGTGYVGTVGRVLLDYYNAETVGVGGHGENVGDCKGAHVVAVRSYRNEDYRTELWGGGDGEKGKGTKWVGMCKTCHKRNGLPLGVLCFPPYLPLCEPVRDSFNDLVEAYITVPELRDNDSRGVWIVHVCRDGSGGPVGVCTAVKGGEQYTWGWTGLREVGGFTEVLGGGRKRSRGEVGVEGGRDVGVEG